MINCPLCNKSMRDHPGKTLTCECGLTIWKEISGRILTPREMAELLTIGHTPVLSGFKARSGKPFSAALVFDRDARRIRFDFARDEAPASCSLRVESFNSGSVQLKSPFLNARVSYGLVSSRLAEIYGCITLTRMAPGGKIQISLNSADAVRYILREAWPRDRETQTALKFLWALLEDKDWTCALDHRKNRKLYGGETSTAFPKGIFPWFDAAIEKDTAGVLVSLKDWPDLRAQFTASIRTASLAEAGSYRVPAAAEKVVSAWLYSVRGEDNHVAKGS